MLTFYNEKFVPEGHFGCVRFPFGVPVIFIRPGHENDGGIHAHEERHVRQWGLVTAATLAMMLMAMAFVSPSFGLVAMFSGLAFPLLYVASKKFRLWCEIDAYRIQLKHSPNSKNEFADLIVSKYGVSVDRDYVIEQLEK